MSAVPWFWTLFPTTLLSAVFGAALLGVLLGWLGIALRLWQTQRSLPVLAVPPAAPSAFPSASLPGGAPWPALSVLVPARNEAPHVAEALRSLLAQDYPALTVVAIDDRSDDDTGTLLEALAQRDPRLTVLHVTDLPDGWLGKNHANHLGAARAPGDLLLFTDADVVFAPGALRAAVACLLSYGLGHLAAAPRLVAPGYLERAFLATFALYFALRHRLWALRRAGSAAYVGIGACNLVRRADYHAVGGHARLALEVVDDVRLGLLLRRGGVRQALADSGGLLSLRWQPGFWATQRGLLKNVFADCEFRWATILVSAVGLAGLGLLPWVALLAALPGWVALSPLAGCLAGAAVAVQVLLLGAIARRTAGGSGLEGVAAPLTHLAFVGVVLASAALTTWRGGLVWRGTDYPLPRLRAAALRARDLPRSGAVGW